MKKITGMILLAFFICLFVVQGLLAQTPPPGTTVSTSLNGIVEKTSGGLVLNDKEMNMIYMLTGKDVSTHVGKKIFAIGQLTFKEGGKKVFDIKQVTDVQ